MNEFVRFLYPAYAFKIILVAAIIVLCAALRFLWYLKHNHEKVWISLGRPTFILNNSLANQIAVLKILHKGDYKKLNDLKFARISFFYLLALWGFIALFVVMFLIIVMWLPGNTR